MGERKKWWILRRWRLLDEEWRWRRVCMIINPTLSLITELLNPSWNHHDTITIQTTVISLISSAVIFPRIASSLSLFDNLFRYRFVVLFDSHILFIVIWIYSFGINFPRKADSKSFHQKSLLQYSDILRLTKYDPKCCLISTDLIPSGTICIPDGFLSVIADNLWVMISCKLWMSLISSMIRLFISPWGLLVSPEHDRLACV